MEVSTVIDNFYCWQPYLQKADNVNHFKNNMSEIQFLMFKTGKYYKSYRSYLIYCMKPFPKLPLTTLESGFFALLFKQMIFARNFPLY